MRRLPCIAWLVGLLFCPGLAHAYVRSAVSRADGGSGPCLYWGPRTVHYLLNDKGLSTLPMETVKTSIQAGFDAWTGYACSDFSYVFDGTTPHWQVGYSGVLRAQPQLTGEVANDHLVVFREKACADVVPSGDECLLTKNADCDNKYNCWGSGSDTTADSDTVALTLVTTDPPTGRILDADTAFDAVDFTFVNFDGGDCSPDVDPSRCLDITNTMSHEAGHFLGLGHSQETSATMYFSILTVHETSKRDLASDDLAGLCAIYPVGQPPVTCVASPPVQVYGSGCGCGAASSGGLAFSLLGSLVVLARVAKRRRPN